MPEPILRPDIASLRESYTRDGLSEADALGDPIAQFDRWFHDAVSAGLKEPNAMTLATATADGRPSARIVLLKSFDEHGFVFFTNYGSRKGQELDANPAAALVFYWAELERQVRIEGHVTRVSPATTGEYFHSRPRGSQIGAWASRQSTVIAGREVLDEATAELERRFGAGEVPVPAFWGGYVLVPEALEFWQGRPSRLHDRLLYQRTGGVWRRDRLSP